MQDIQGVTNNLKTRQALLQLSNGRKLSYSVFGKNDFKKVLLYFHGFPGSRLEVEPSAKIAEKLGITVLAFDRPGIGDSDFLQFKSFLHFAGDIEEALKILSIEQVAILAVSGGTPYGLAAAIHLQERVSKISVVSGIGDFTEMKSLSGINFGNRMFIGISRMCHPLGVLLVSCMAKLWREVPAATALWFQTVLPKEDLKIIQRPEIGSALIRGMRAALRPGIRGVVGEFSRMMRPWNLDFSKINAPLTIWHGEADTYVPTSMSLCLKEKIHSAKLELVPQGGHFMVFDKMEEILKSSYGN